MIETPFNYTGSKFKLLEQLLPEFDTTKSTFVDVFTGGGSVYTNVLDKYEKVIVNDIITDFYLHYIRFRHAFGLLQKLPYWIITK
jgi:site-specific DNA-adenine methylase